MSNLMDLLQNQISTGLIDQLSKQIGGADQQKTAVAANGIMSTIMEGLAKNASTPEGASSLLGALDRDHDGSVLNDIMGLIGGGSQPAAQQKSNNGLGILRHVLGNNSDNVMTNISKMSGLDLMSVANIATKIAPIAMGILGNQKKQNGLDAGGLVDFLSKSVQTQRASNPEGSIFAKLLDQDGDGSVVDDIAGMGMKLFGNFLK